MSSQKTSSNRHGRKTDWVLGNTNPRDDVGRCGHWVRCLCISSINRLVRIGDHDSHVPNHLTECPNTSENFPISFKRNRIKQLFGSHILVFLNMVQQQPWWADLSGTNRRDMLRTSLSQVLKWTTGWIIGLIVLVQPLTVASAQLEPSLTVVEPLPPQPIPPVLPVPAPQPEPLPPSPVPPPPPVPLPPSPIPPPKPEPIPPVQPELPRPSPPVPK
jgi:hypothetical protein